MRPVRAVALALLLVTAGCSGVGGTGDDPPTVAPGLDGTPTRTVEPTVTPPATPTADAPLPPGMRGEDDEVDERALYVTHARALEGRSVTWRDQRLRTNATGTVLGWSTRTVRTNGSHQRYEVETGGADPAAVRTRGTTPEYWTNGTVTVSRLVLPDGSAERRRVESGPTRTFEYVETGHAVLRGPLTRIDLRYVGAVRGSGTTLYVLSGTTDDARLTVRVASDGVVRSLVHRTRVRVDGRVVTSVTRFRTYDVGSTVVERPEWAANATE